MPYVDRGSQRETAATWAGEGPFHCAYCAFLSHSCCCQAQCSAPVPSFVVCLLSLGMMYRCFYHPFFPERPQPSDLHPKKSHSPAPSSFVHCLCLHGSLSPFLSTWFYPSSSVDEMSPLPHLSVIVTHLLLASWLQWRGISSRGGAEPQRGRVQWENKCQKFLFIWISCWKFTVEQMIAEVQQFECEVK